MNFVEMSGPLAKASVIFKKLKVKYKNMDAYLVVSSRFGQAKADASSVECLGEFPALFFDSEEKRAACIELKAIKKLASLIKGKKKGLDPLKRSKIERETDSRLETLRILADLFLVDESVQIELRFKTLNYELVWALQKDPLVDHALTAQSKASIRIVLGTLGTLKG